MFFLHKDTFVRAKNFTEIALSQTVSEINGFLHLMQTLKMALSCTIFEINVFLLFM